MGGRGWAGAGLPGLAGQTGVVDQFLLIFVCVWNVCGEGGPQQGFATPENPPTAPASKSLPGASFSLISYGRREQNVLPR